MIPAGSFFALLGPSGCGKTTTLRLVAGLEEPTAGRILIGGKDVTAVKPHKRPVSTVFQSYALFPHMSVLDNVALRAQAPPGVGSRSARAHEQALRCRARPPVVPVAPAQLSGGQQQRVALARASVNRPALLLPSTSRSAPWTSSLRRQMQLELKSIQSEVGLTFLHVTHDQEEAMTMADTVAVMNKGRIEQTAVRREELYELPRRASSRLPRPAAEPAARHWSSPRGRHRHDEHGRRGGHRARGAGRSPRRGRSPSASGRRSSPWSGSEPPHDAARATARTRSHRRRVLHRACTQVIGEMPGLGAITSDTSRRWCSARCSPPTAEGCGCPGVVSTGFGLDAAREGRMAATAEEGPSSDAPDTDRRRRREAA